MDTLDDYRRAVETVLIEYTKIPYAYGDIRTEAVFDRSRALPAGQRGLARRPPNPRLHRPRRSHRRQAVSTARRHGVWNRQRACRCGRSERAHRPGLPPAGSAQTHGLRRSVTRRIEFQRHSSDCATGPAQKVWQRNALVWRFLDNVFLRRPPPDPP